MESPTPGQGDGGVAFSDSSLPGGSPPLLLHGGDAATVPGTSEGAPAEPFPRTAPAAPAVRPHFHHYEICLRENGASLFELGRGSMGVSYKARDVNLDITVAIKVIRAALPSQSNARERFRREARAAAQLRHPNVASVFHFGETPEGECFYAMEFVEGETLAARVGREGPLPAALAVEIALQVTAALIAADERGLVHRDLKPANVMLAAPVRRPSARGPEPVNVKVIDFGLAKAASAGAPLLDLVAPLTQEGGFLGTPAYASPEQGNGGQIDARSDIYSLGVTLWFLLAGKAPFFGRSLTEISDRQMHRPLPLAQLTDLNVPPALIDLLSRMLAPKPEKRPASPAALYEELARCGDTLGEPAAPKTAEAPSRSRPWALAAVIGVALAALAAGGFYFARRPPAVVVPAAAPDKSIAVLPLEDLSDDKASAFFADGIQDDLLSSLSKIKDLKVISRSSVTAYRNSATRDLREIGRQLGVAHLLEGSVRRAADRVVLQAALIDTRDGRVLWSERFDRTLKDSLSLQGELATEIAAALRATLSPEERQRIEDRPTGNADAYVLYLRARDHHTRPTHLRQDLQSAAALYAQAIELDPQFALAHARLSAALAYIFQNYQPTPENKARAQAEAAEALRLRPNSGEGHLAQALCLYWTEKNYPAALAELEVAARLMPGDAEIDLYTGAIHRRQGRWREALGSMRQALARDPRSVMIAREIMITDCSLRDWPAARRDGERAVALAPDLPLLRVENNWIDFWARGDLGALRADLRAVPPGVDPDGGITVARWDAALAARDFPAAEQGLTNGAPAFVVTSFGPVLPKEYLLGCVALARGDAARAKPLLESALPAVEAEGRNYPLDAFRQAKLGLLYAYLGRKEDAIRCGERATQILPESRDALNGACVSGWLALIYARTGENDKALTLIERLLNTPGAVFAASEGSITHTELRMRWQWDPLRKDPRFEKILTAAETPLVYH